MNNCEIFYKQQSKRGVPIQRQLFYVSYMFFLVFIVFILGEIAVRLIYPPIPQLRSIIEFVNDERIYVLKPNAKIRFEGLWARFIHPVIWEITAQGIRDSKLVEYEPKKKKHRIAIYGDSETFGWSVDLEDTFEKQMEKMDNGLEVINFGVPGYNISQIAEHIEKTAGRYNADLVIYVIHPNDFDPPISIYKANIHSEFVKRIIVLYNIVKRKRAEKKRRSPIVVNKFVAELVRIIRFCEKNNISFTLAFLDWNDSFVLKRNQELSSYFLYPYQYREKIFDFSYVFGNYRKMDSHLTKEGHKKLAGLLLKSVKDNMKE